MGDLLSSDSFNSSSPVVLGMFRTVKAGPVWGLTLLPGRKEVVVPSGSDIHITLATLTEDVQNQDCRTAVKLFFRPNAFPPSGLTVEKEITPCTLVPMAVESVRLDLWLYGEETYVFEIRGENAICIYGNYIVDRASGPIPAGLPAVPSTARASEEPHAFEDADRFEQTRKRRRTDTTSQEQDSKTTGSVRMDILAETTTYTPRPTALLPSKHTQLSGTAGGLYPLPEQPPSHSNTEDSTVSGNAAKPQLTVVSKSGHKTLIQLDESARQVTCHDTQIGEGQSAAVGNTVQLHLIVTVHPGNKVIARTSQTKMHSFKVGQGDFIKGLNDGLIGMKPGGERVIVVPPCLGFGKTVKELGKGVINTANSILVCEVKLVSVE